jgi:hypothetical protein
MPPPNVGSAGRADVGAGVAEHPRVRVRRSDEDGEEGAGRDSQALELEILAVGVIPTIMVLT